MIEQFSTRRFCKPDLHPHIQSLFQTSIPFLELMIRAAVIYGFVLFLIRISGKRQIGQLSAIEFVTILLISNAVQNSMNGGDHSLIGGMILSVVLVALSVGIATWSKGPPPFSSVMER